MVDEHDIEKATLAELQTSLQRLEDRFHRACDQIVLMNKKLAACNFRYKRAKARDMKNFRYQLRLRLAVVEGVRNMYYDYATQKAAQVETVRNLLEVRAMQEIRARQDNSI